MKALGIGFCMLAVAASATYSQNALAPVPTGVVLPYSMACERLGDLNDLIGAAEQGGPYASLPVFKRINATAKSEHRPGCQPVETASVDVRTMHVLETFASIETISNILTDVLVVEIQGARPYIAIQRLVVPGRTL